MVKTKTTVERAKELEDALRARMHASANLEVVALAHGTIAAQIIHPDPVSGQKMILTRQYMPYMPIEVCVHEFCGEANEILLKEWRKSLPFRREGES